ncbi:MAG: hypothetical protein QOG26_68 [Solirubrobacterales bacterium]|jgi:polyhydroxyalkanoate synthesis regulator phasin|nr:hypothetical protein [Solirubrobacterales bacterium]
MSEQRKDQGLADELRNAVERTFAAVTDSAAGTRGRAQELLDEAVRRGQGARDEALRRSQGAREEALRRGQGAREIVEKELDSLRKRIGELESALGLSKAPSGKDKQQEK